MKNRLLIEWVNDGDGYYKIYDLESKTEICCNSEDVNEVIYELLEG